MKAEHENLFGVDPDDLRAAWRTAADAADRFRDILVEVLDLPEKPGDDALVAAIRERHGKAGPEPTKWRSFLDGQIERLVEASSLGTPEAKALREAVPLERAQAIVAQANAMASRGRCECDPCGYRADRGLTGRCEREAFVHVASDGTPFVASPALCMGCLHGCTDDET